MTDDTQAIAARLTALVASAERLIAADDGSQEKADAIDALYLNFNYREIRADLAHVETLTQQVAELTDLAAYRDRQCNLLAIELNGWRFRAEQAEQQRDAAHAALKDIRALAHDCPEHDARLTLDEMQHQIDAALAASAPQKGTHD